MSADVVARRRAVLATLAATTVLGAAAWPLLPAAGLPLAGVGAAGTTAYVALLWRLQQRRALRRRVRHLGPGTDAAPVGREVDATAPFGLAPPARAVGHGDS